MLLRKSAVFLSAVATAGATALVVSPPAQADPDIAGTYNTITPTRVIDTRNGTGAPQATIGSQQTLTARVTSPLPAAASPSAVALTVTVVSPASSGFVSVYQGGTTRPGVSNVNFVGGENTANSTVVRVSDTGTVSFYNGSAKPVSLLADVYGYWTGGEVSDNTGGALHTVDPTRITDSRDSESGGSPIAAGASATVDVTGGEEGVPASGVSAVVVNITAVAPTVGGLITADNVPDSADTSTLNFAARATRSNLAIVPVDQDGNIYLRNGSRAALNYLVDVFGYFDDGAPSVDGSYVSSSAYRAADSRGNGGPVAARGTYKVPLFPDSDSGSLFKAVTVNVTATAFTTGGSLTPYSGTGSRPITSVSNYNGTNARATTVVVPVNSDGSISIYNGSTGTVQIIVDVEGFALNDSASSMSSAQVQHRINISLKRARAFSAKHVQQ